MDGKAVHTWVCQRIWVFKSHKLVDLCTALLLHNATPYHNSVHSILCSLEVSCDVHKGLHVHMSSNEGPHHSHCSSREVVTQGMSASFS